MFDYCVSHVTVLGSGRGQVSAYPRQLESLIRLAESHAKMRLSNKVEVSDVQEARRYAKVCPDIG